jgi:hypothetical protein
VSKKHSAKKKRKSRARRGAACPRCHAPADSSPGAILSALAAILNTAADAGMPVRFAHGAATTREGYVLPLTGGRWTARALTYDPLSPPPGDEDDGDD